MGTGSNLDRFIIVQVVSCRLTGGNFGLSNINQTNCDEFEQFVQKHVSNQYANGVKNACHGVNKYHCGQMNNWCTKIGLLH